MNLDPLVFFLKERLPFFPWGIIPVIIFVLGSIPGPFEFILLYNLLWGVFFVRCLNEVFCLDYNKKETTGFPEKIDKRSGIILTLIFGVLFISSLLLIHSILNVIIVFAFIFISSIAYYTLRNKKQITYIHYFHYPLFFYLVFSY